MSHLISQAILVVISVGVFCEFVRSANLTASTSSSSNTAATDLGSSETADYARMASEVASRQRQGMFYWVLIVGAAGLGLILIMSALTVLYSRRSRKVYMRNKKSQSSGANITTRTIQEETSKHKEQNSLSPGEQMERNCDRTLLSVPNSQRAVHSVISWGSEFDTIDCLSENIYNNATPLSNASLPVTDHQTADKIPSLPVTDHQTEDKIPSLHHLTSRDAALIPQPFPEVRRSKKFRLLHTLNDHSRSLKVTQNVGSAPPKERQNVGSAPPKERQNVGSAPPKERQNADGVHSNYFNLGLGQSAKVSDSNNFHPGDLDTANSHLVNQSESSAVSGNISVPDFLIKVPPPYISQTSKNKRIPTDIYVNQDKENKNKNTDIYVNQGKHNKKANIDIYVNGTTL